MNIATLGIAIDPTKAQAGAAEAKKALKGVEDQAERTTKAASGVANGFQSMVGRMVSSLTNLLQFAPGTTGLFANMAQGAQAAAQSFAGLTAAGGALGIALGALAAAAVAAVAAIVGLGIAVSQTFKAIAAAAEVQKLEFQFSVILGSAEKAKQRMAELAKFAAETPFELPEVARASKVLETLTKGALSSGQALTNIGDAAAFTGTRYDDLAVIIGRVYAAIQGGRALGDEAMRLQELGILTTDTRGRIEQMMASHEDAGKTWDLVEQSLRRFSGTMAGQAQLWDGLMSTMRDNWRILYAEFGKPILIELTPVLKEINAILESLVPKAQAAGQAVAESIAMLKALLSSGNLSEIFWLTFRIKAREAFTDMVTWAPKLIIGIFTTIFDSSSPLNQAMSRFLEAFGESFGGQLFFAFRTAGAALEASAEVVVQTIKNAYEFIKSGGGLIGDYTPSTVSFGAAFDEKMQTVRSDAVAQQIAAAEAMSKATAGLSDKIGSFIENLAKFGGEEEKARLQELLEQARKTAEAGLQATQAASQATTAAANVTTAAAAYVAPADKGFKSDSEIMRDLNRKMDILANMYKAGQISGNELTRRGTEFQGEAISNLSDPAAARQGQYGNLIDKYRTMQEERARISAETEAKIQANAATTGEVFNQSFQQIMDEWGSLQQQMERGIVGIVNSIANNLTGALNDFVLGTKDAKTAFRDMAVAILKDIVNIINRMLVQLAIQAALKALGFGGGGGGGGGGFAQGGSVGNVSDSVSSVNSAATSSSTYVGSGNSIGGEPTLDMNNMGFAIEGMGTYASGGRVRGGRGGIDDIPALLTRGEFVIPKEAVDYYGLDYLERLRNRRAQRFATGGLAGGNGASPGTGDGINITINVDARNEKATTDVKGGDNKTDKKKGEDMGRSLEAAMLQFVQREKRPGGALAR